MESREELKGRLKRSGFTFLGVFIFLFTFQIRTARIHISSTQTLPYPFPNPQGSIVTQTFRHIQVSLLPESVSPMTVHPTDGITAVIYTALLLTFTVVMPYLIYQAIKFLSPALYPEEKTMLKRMMMPSSLLFIGGVLFSYFVFLPVALRFLFGWAQALGATTMITLSNFMSFNVIIMLSMGLTFQLPLVQMALTKTGLVDENFWLAKKRWFILFVIVFGAIVTPADVVTLFLFAGPCLILYLTGAYLSKRYAGVS